MLRSLVGSEMCIRDRLCCTRISYTRSGYHQFFSGPQLIYIPFLANYPLRTVITVLSESIRKKTLILKFLRIPYTHGVFRHFSTSLRRVPRWWRGPAVARGTSGGRPASPKALEPAHFRAKHRRRNQYLILHILVLFFRHSNGRQEHDLGLRFVEDRFGYK